MGDPDESRQTFGKRSRLTEGADFERVFKEGKHVGSDRIAARVVANELGRPRLGFVTPRAIGAHPKRNRVRRVMREAYRLNQGMLAAGVDVVFMPKRDWTDYTLAEAEPSMQKLLRRIEDAYGQSG